MSLSLSTSSGAKIPSMLGWLVVLLLGVCAWVGYSASPLAALLRCVFRTVLMRGRRQFTHLHVIKASRDQQHTVGAVHVDLEPVEGPLAPQDLL